MKQIVLFTTVVLSIILAFAVTWQLISIVLLFLLSLVIAATLRSPIDALIQRGLSRTLSTSIIYGVLLVLIVGMLLIFSIALMDELSQLLTDLSTVYTRLQLTWQNGNRLGPMVAERLPPPEQVAQWVTEGDLANLAQGALGLTQNMANLLSQLMVALVLSIYWTTDRLRFERLWLSFLPTAQRIEARSIWRALEDGVGLYTRSELLQSFLAGGLLTGGYWLLGLHYPFLLALIAALAWLIPLVGGLIALIPLAAVSWLNVNPLLFATAILYTIVVLFVMEFVVERRLYPNNRYQRVLVLLVMIALADVYGLIGLLIAPFLATIIQISLTKLMEASTKPAPATLSDSLRLDLRSLEERLDEVQMLIQDNQGEPTTRRVSSLTERLSRLVQETEAIQNGSPSLLTPRAE
ncbi:MAG: AI-2E family transporter [Caldilineaceae bacterium]|nr:AI-2E family transporter [Caldilineaceae bacterium]MCB9148583.1 AI-2E family transporter [Caldilineaceae bacterium]